MSLVKGGLLAQIAHPAKVVYYLEGALVRTNEINRYSDTLVSLRHLKFSVSSFRVVQGLVSGTKKRKCRNCNLNTSTLTCFIKPYLSFVRSSAQYFTLKMQKQLVEWSFASPEGLNASFSRELPEPLPSVLNNFNAIFYVCQDSLPCSTYIRLLKSGSEKPLGLSIIKPLWGVVTGYFFPLHCIIIFSKKLKMTAYCIRLKQIICSEVEWYNVAYFWLNSMIMLLMLLYFPRKYSWNGSLGKFVQIIV